MRKKKELDTELTNIIFIYAVYKKLVYKRIRHSKLEDINDSELIEEEIEGRMVL